MTAVAYIDYYTKDDFYRWEGDWELIEGVPYAMAPFALPNHQRISGKIFRQIDEAFDKCFLCNVFMETEIEFSEDTIVRPDVSVVCYEYQNKLTKAPVMIFEVVSKSSIKRDELLKYELYKKEGVRFYVLVYPEVKKAKVFELDNGIYKKIGDYSDEKVKFSFECKFEFDFSKIWQ